MIRIAILNKTALPKTGEGLLASLEDERQAYEDRVERHALAAEARQQVVRNEIARLQQESEQLDSVKVTVADIRGS